MMLHQSLMDFSIPKASKVQSLWFIIVVLDYWRSWVECWVVLVVCWPCMHWFIPVLTTLIGPWMLCSHQQLCNKYYNMHTPLYTCITACDCCWGWIQIRSQRILIWRCGQAVLVLKLHLLPAGLPPMGRISAQGLNVGFHWCVPKQWFPSLI